VIPFDRLRAALLDPEPHRAMDRLVRGELAAGRRTRTIYDDLLGHFEAVRAMPEYTDAMEDPLGDTMDALLGHCHPSWAYRDPEPAADLNGRPSAADPAPARSPE
jgi:hypothetical protein